MCNEIDIVRCGVELLTFGQAHYQHFYIDDEMLYLKGRSATANIARAYMFSSVYK